MGCNDRDKNLRPPEGFASGGLVVPKPGLVKLWAGCVIVNPKKKANG